MKRSSNFLVLATTLFALVLLGACGGGADTDTQMQDTAMTDPGMTSMPTDTAAAAQTQQKLNLNTATEDEFMALPGVGERMVGEFMEYRPYVSIRQFRESIGNYVDEDVVAGYEQYVFVPIDPNESDEATLQQIPGVNEQLAAELAAARPYDSNQAFLDALSDRLSPQQVATAEQYLATE